jgi:EmrB/QacA subfamily drug resistance transporter
MREWQLDGDLVHRRRWMTLVILCLSLIVIVVDNTILNVAIPTLSKSPAKGGLGAADSDLQWIVDAYVLVFAGLLLTAGALSDRFGRYRALAGGLATFGIASTVAANSDSVGPLIAARAFMGIGAAFIMPATLSIIANVFRDPAERGRAIGIWAGVASLGVAIGPVTGGFLLEHFWWGSVLLVNVPIVAVALVFGFFLVPDSRDPAAPRLDFPGALLSIVGLTSLLYGIIEGPTKGWLSGEVVGGFAAGLALLVGFVAWEHHTDHPMLDVNFFRNPRFSAASAGITLAYMAMMGMVFLFTQYMQAVLEFSPLKAGAVLVPMSAVMAVLAPLSSRQVERFGSKLVLTAGLLVVTFALAIQVGLTPGTPTLLVVLATLPLGVGMAHVLPTATASIMGAVPREKAGVGSAVNDTTRQMGGALGVALMGSVMASRYGDHVTSGLSGSGLSHKVLGRIGDNVQAGVAVGHEAGGSLGGRIVDVAHEGFVAGMHVAVVVGAAITLVAAAAVYRWLPARAPEVAPVDLPTGDREREAEAERELEPAPVSA